MHPHAVEAAAVIDRQFEQWLAAFRHLSARHATHFARQDWSAGAREDQERLALYEQHIQQAIPRLRDLIADSTTSARWAQVRGAFIEVRAGKPNLELAQTFYNSITRRVLRTVGVDPRIEFVAEALVTPRTLEAKPAFDAYEPTGDTAALLQSVIESFDLGVPWEDAERDARRVAELLDARLDRLGTHLGRLDVLRPVFYRNKGAYLIAHVHGGDTLVPLVLPVLHTESGQALRIDAALTTANEASQVFSFTRSYFHVDYPEAWGLVRFLKTLVPLKRIAELYLSLGFTKHGKTELYRDLTAYLDGSHDRFTRARGTRGMVMSVFTLPGYDIVFKLIKDKFDPVKPFTRDHVLRKYRFVMLHDRVGRLADVQEFEHLEFPVRRFDPTLLEELLAECARTVHVEDDRVVIEHLYTERRVTPLNLFLQEAPEAKALAAVVDAGYAVKDLAASNIFPGDMLVKNFGVTRHGRVIFYDYDELDRLNHFTFREKPKPRSEHDMMSDESWFYVGPNDIFPEEIAQFMGFPRRFAEAFREAHPELLTVEFWKEMQSRQHAEEPIDLFPYPPSKQFA